MIIEGVLRLGQYSSAPSGTEGALYYDTTENTTKIYSDSAWGDLGGSGEPGQLPAYTSTQRDVLSPAEGQQIYNTTENKVQVYGQDAWKTVHAKLALAATCSLDGDCDSAHCVDGYCCDTVCSGTVCQTCGSLSSNGVGNCGYVNNSSQDPRNTCTTASPPSANSCKSPNCNGTGYTCSYLNSGEQSQPVCKRCTGSSYDPVNIAQGSYDAEGTNTCTATHYRCDGSANCTNPTQAVCRLIATSDTTSCNARCSAWGYPGCLYRDGSSPFDCVTQTQTCSQLGAGCPQCACKCSAYVY